MSELKAGDVVRVNDHGDSLLGIVRPRKASVGGDLEIAYATGGYDLVEEVEHFRPLVVIDLEPDQAQTLSALLSTFPAPLMQRLAVEIREQFPPPKREVVEHLIIAQHSTLAFDEPTLHTLCGKQFRSSDDVTVVGRCSECTEKAGRWVA